MVVDGNVVTLCIVVGDLFLIFMICPITAVEEGKVTVIGLPPVITIKYSILFSKTH